MSVIHFQSISDFHAVLGLEKPLHPLILLVDVSKMKVTEDAVNQKVVFDFYMISLKNKSCGVEYGRNSFDFSEGVMVFSSPKQVYTPTKKVEEGEMNCWMLFFHPDLIRNTSLGGKIDEYSFFNYNFVEALHLSESEEFIMNTTIKNIKTEYEQRIDNHSQRVIVSSLELLLNYSLRFYERQFNTRASNSKDVVSRFEKELKEYFKSKKQLELGTPSIQYFADKANFSQHYFSDLIKKETGSKPKDHINNYIIDKAKNLLLGSEQSINEIAYQLGFNYPHYFSRLFKTKTGHSPLEYRNLN